MLKKTITYKDFDGNTRTEDHYFHFTKAELMEMQMGVTGGLDAMIKRLISAQDQPGIMKATKEIISKAYGIKSPDGRKFDKSPEIFADFERTEAYSVLFMELITNSEAAADFVNGLIPEGMPKPDLKEITAAAGLPQA